MTPPRPPQKKKFFFKRVRRELRVRALLWSLPLLRKLPTEAGALIGTLAWYLVGRQRRLALEHLRIAFPEKSENDRRPIGRASFANLGRAALETVRADATRVTLSPEDEALLRAAHAEGKGVLLVTGHIGAWELFARRVAATGLPSATVAREAQDPRLTAVLQLARQSAEVKVFWRGSPLAARELIRWLKGGGLLGILIDQDTRVAGYHVPFFGRPAFTPRAAGDLAARFGCPIIFGCAHRMAGNVHRTVFRRLSVPLTGDRETDSKAVTAEATKMIEQEIRANPVEWVWMHPRWRTPPST